MDRYINRYVNNTPHLISNIQTKIAAKFMLQERKNFLEAAFEDGILVQEEWESLKEHIGHQMNEIHKFRPESQDDCTIIGMLFPPLAVFGKERLDNFEKLCEKNVITLKKGEKKAWGVNDLNKILLIKTGTVTVESKGFEPSKRTAGEMINLISLVYPKCEVRAYEVEAHEHTTLYEVPMEEIAGLMNENKDYKESCYRHSLWCFVKFLEKESDRQIFKGISESKMTSISERCSTENLGEGHSTCMKYGGLVISGKLEETVPGPSDYWNKIDNILTYKDMTLVLPTERHVVAKNDTMVLKFPPGIFEMHRSKKTGKASIKIRKNSVFARFPLMALGGAHGHSLELDADIKNQYRELAKDQELVKILGQQNQNQDVCCEDGVKIAYHDDFAKNYKNSDLEDAHIQLMKTHEVKRKASNTDKIEEAPKKPVDLDQHHGLVRNQTNNNMDGHFVGGDEYIEEPSISHSH